MIKRSHARRAAARSMRRRKVLCLLLCPILLLVFSGCSDNWFRLKPKKGRAHPHPPEAERYNRTWVYKHSEEVQSMYSEEERLYREERARLLVLEKNFYANSVELFGMAMKKIRLLNLKLADVTFADLLFSWFNRALNLEGYSVSSNRISGVANPSDTEGFISACKSSTEHEVRITSDLHYGDDPNDRDTYYEVFNGLFPITQDNQFCRIFRLDIVRFGRKVNGDAADTDKVLSLFSSDDIFTDQAWSSDPSSMSVVDPDYSELENSNGDYPDVLEALFNFMQMNIHKPLGIRFQEILVSKDPADSAVKHSSIYIMSLTKDEVDHFLEQRGSEH